MPADNPTILMNASPFCFRYVQIMQNQPDLIVSRNRTWQSQLIFWFQRVALILKFDSVGIADDLNRLASGVVSVMGASSHK